MNRFLTIIAVLFTLFVLWNVFDRNEAEAISNATLTWTAPTTNADGSPLTDLAGYMLMRGVTPGGPYPSTTDIPDPAATSFLEPSLTDNTAYYWVLVAYDTSGNQSVPSNEATTTTGDTTPPDPPTNLQAE